jgi:hypothetical protein
MKTRRTALSSRVNYFKFGELMARLFIIGVCLLSLIGLAACASMPPAAGLPTATLAPTQVIPTTTSTPAPPPTVTPYPTVTPRSVAEVTVTSETTTDATAQSSQAASTAQTTSTSAATGSVPTPTARSTGGGGTETHGAQLFRTDFSRGWPTLNEASAKIEIVDGQYQFKIGPYDARFMNTSAVKQGDILAQVEVNITDCPEKGGYGLIFRQKDSTNYYSFMVFCSNAYSLIARVNGSLGTGGPMAAGSLPGGMSAQSGTHTLAVRAEGSSITIYIDGQSLAQVSDERFTTGDIAMYVFSESGNVVQVAFDNLEVWAAK